MTSHLSPRGLCDVRIVRSPGTSGVLSSQLSLDLATVVSGAFASHTVCFPVVSHVSHFLVHPSFLFTDTGVHIRITATKAHRGEGYRGIGDKFEKMSLEWVWEISPRNP